MGFDKKTRNKLQQAIYTFIAIQTASDNDSERLNEIFLSLDTDGNGVLTREELVKGFTLAKTYISEEEARREVEMVLANVDSNYSGKIDFSEFMLATAKRDELL